jgi:hydroxymethylbilane synthase
MTLRLGTRGSQLAVAQSQWVADRIQTASGRPVELVIISTKGDRVTDRPLAQVGGKGLFTKEIEEALLASEIDFAVHSMKDMPTEAPRGLVIGAVPERESPWDALVGKPLQALEPGDVVGTGSARRASQLQRLRPDLVIRGIRGNVDTRIAKQRAGEYDSVVLALAGLRRLGRGDEASDVLDQLIPAVGQGALALQARRKDELTLNALESIHHEMTGLAISAERAFLEALSGGCSVPAGAYAQVVGHEVLLRACFAPDGDYREVTLRADWLHTVMMGRDAAAKLL